MRKYLGFFAALAIIWAIIVLSGMVLLAKYNTCRQAGHNAVVCILATR